MIDIESIVIYRYTVADVRNWLQHNQVPIGLDEHVIRPSFAWSLIHNPYVNDNDYIVAAVYVQNKLAAATCAFPEELEHPIVRDEYGHKSRVWWFPMLWCKSEYRGQHIGTRALSALAESYGWQYSWTAWAVPASCRIFEKHGHVTHHFLRYFFGDKRIAANTIKGKMAVLKQNCQKCLHKLFLPKLPHYDYELQYMTNVDNESYEFIKAHHEAHFVHSSQAKMNWDLHYPWNVTSPLKNRVPVTGEYFADIVPEVQNMFVQVRVKGHLVGAYRLSISNTSLSCENVYYESGNADVVFASVVEHIKHYESAYFDTEDQELAKYVKEYIFFPRSYSEQLTFTISSNIKVPEPLIR